MSFFSCNVHLSLFLVLFLAVLAPVLSHGQELPLSPSNAGFTGLLDMPNARVLPDWSVRPFYSWSDPYYTFGGSAGIFPRVELSGRITGIKGISALGPGYGDLKDKAIDFKVLLIDEDAYSPAFALGASDIHGTALFASRYIVASKHFGPLDVTLGAGQGILAGEQIRGPGSSGAASEDAAFTFLTSSPLDHSTSIFGGAELHVSEKFSLVGEYSSLDYTNLRGGSQAPDPAMNFNFGLRYRPWPSLLMNASLMRGNTFGWSLASPFPLQPEGMLPWKIQPFWRPTEALRERALNATNEELAVILRDEIAAERFTSVRVSVSDASAWVEMQNPTYLSNAKALGRALRAVSALVPPRIEWLYISLKSRDIILFTIKLSRQDFDSYLDSRMDDAGLLEFITFSNDGIETRDAFLAREKNPSPLTESLGGKKYFFSWGPKVQTYFNDPSGFLKHRLSLIWNGYLLPWPGAMLKGRIRTPLYNGITGVGDTTEKNAIRSDSNDFMEGTDMRLEILAFDQVFDLPAAILGRVGFGLLETAYGGAGMEAYRTFDDGNWGVGMEGTWARKRDPQDDFRLEERDYYTLFLNVHHKLFPVFGVDTGMKLGRFLGGDWGVRFDVSRTYRYFTMGAWYTVTDSADVFTASFNKGYHDKGIYIRVPFSVFKDHDSPVMLNYGIRPWGRDTGQFVSHINSLYPMADLGSFDTFKRNLPDLRK